MMTLLKEQCRHLVAEATGKKILVVGDIILDRFVWGTVDRISPEAPVQVVQVRRENVALGGAANVAGNLAALGNTVTMVGVTGNDDHAGTVVSEFQRLNLSTDGILRDGRRPTITKTRIIAGTQQIVRIDHEITQPISAGMEKEIIQFLAKVIPGQDLVVISDYQKGTLTDKILFQVLALAERQRLPSIVDPKRKDLTLYGSATLIKPNQKEAEAAWGRKIKTDADAEQAARDLRKRHGFGAVLITRGKEGMTLVDKQGVHRIGATAREVFDVTGAGDTVTAYLAWMLANGRSFEEAATIANIAAAVAVSRVGTVSVRREDVLHELDDMTSGSRKILTADELDTLLPSIRRDRTIVFTNGCFDILHVGHITLLNKARALGDQLIVGLNSDASVRRIKGEKRPIVSEQERAHILSAIAAVDFVVLFNEDTPMDLIRRLRPDVLVKGSDYTVDKVVGHDIVESYGGRVALVDLVAGFSTTNVVESILKNYGGESTSAARKAISKAREKLDRIRSLQDRLEKKIAAKEKPKKKPDSRKHK